MGVVRNIAAMYRGPGAVVRRLLDAGPREDRALAYVMGACGLMFVAQAPRLAREAHMQGTDLDMLLGGALMGWIFLAPLALYGIAALSYLVLRATGAQPGGWPTRIVLFWALLAASPLFLLLGLTHGFVGPGIEANIVGIAWLAAFLWFWGAGLAQARRQGMPA